MEKHKNSKSSLNHKLVDIIQYQKQAILFFSSQLILLKLAIPKITDEKQSKAAVLLMSCGQTGAATVQLAAQTDTFTTQMAMLARSFVETIINFCYVCVCDEQEYRAFILHPIYKHFHNVDLIKLEDDIDFLNQEDVKQNIEIKIAKKEKLKKIPIVEEALAIFSEKKSNLNWTKKNLNQRIQDIKKWGKILDVFFKISKNKYYSDASEALHGSLYGCTYGIGAFEPEFDPNKKDELEKKLYKESTSILIHLGILIHESLTLISYSNDIKEIWDNSYENRSRALSLLFHVLGRKPTK